MKLKELLYLLYYSFKSFFVDMREMLEQLKKPTTWSYMLVVAFLLAAYYGKIKLVMYILPLIILIKIVRDKIDGAYKRELFDKDIEKNKNSDVVRDYYEKYKKNCYFKEKPPLDYEEWKKAKKELDGD